ncbi:MAG TPA: metallophosphoesterase family protein, partial [Spirochaetia bacterium]|nr:metallophosphoesterase family protein [Spirochaetia bacterium]
TFAIIHYPDLAPDLYRANAHDVVIYGHDHRVRVEGQAKKLLNPGTCAGYLAEAATVALLETADLGIEIVRL